MREDWGRLLALLVAQYRRLDLAEDGLADAVEAAARTWPADGAPDNPPAWLLTAARRRVLDRLRAEAVRARHQPLLEVEASLVDAVDRLDPADLVGDDALPDERLRLVLLCAHPSLAPEHAAALTLRMVMGVSTAEVARLFLVPAPTMAARLTRARKRLAGAGFAVPDGDALAERVLLVGEVAYLAFTAGYSPGTGPDVLRADVAGEALRLVRVVRGLLPSSCPEEVRHEADALLALLLLQHSRRGARVDEDGGLVLLPDQDRTRWDHAAITEALALLTPLATAPASRWLCEALVAAEHAIAPTSAATRWDRVVARYEELLALGESPVVRLNRAVALAEMHGPHAGLEALAAIDADRLPGHRLPGVRAELLARAGRTSEALAAFDEAIAACENEAELAHLLRRRAETSR
ncbi:RNA polymerase sigma factor [Nocardioides bruguierae]|uniref:RNA polymerase sigma factor n=1 Tax=Nocardioides bruguierae TaxID=2945102 RepID=UPI002022488C|nr:DUF6596 domain-containing protein [Nocardioides bruguierae]MCL8024137.1 RNA polymerase subunit sigma-24 [Nocardioides bruguierae]